MNEFRKRNREIRTDPANDNYGQESDWYPPGAKQCKPAKSTRKENPRAPDGPEELDEGYWRSLVLGKPCREIFYEWANKEAE